MWILWLVMLGFQRRNCNIMVGFRAGLFNVMNARVSEQDANVMELEKASRRPFT